MKKTIKFFSLILIFTCFIVGCTPETKNNDNVDSPITEIDYKTFNEKLENKDSFVLEVVQTGCSNCSNFTPTLETVLNEYNLTAFSINITNMTESDRTKLLDEYDIDGTPVVLFFKEGRETSTLKRIVGNQEEETVISKFKANGLIENEKEAN